MPQDPTVWIVLIIVAAVVILLLGAMAIRSGRRLKITRGSLEIDKSGSDRPAPAKETISVAENVVIKRSRVGDIAGTKGAGSDASGANIDVAQGAQFEDAEIGDIVGIKGGQQDKS